MNGGKFLDPKSMYSITAWYSPICFFLSVVLIKSMYIPTLSRSLSLSNSFAMLLIHLVFLSCSLDCHILLQNCSASLASSCWYAFVSSPSSCWLNFLSLFRNVLFCLYCFTLSWYLFNLPSFASSFWFISSSCIVIFSCVAFSFLYQYIPAFFLCLIIFACFCRFLSAFSVEFPIQIFCLHSLREPRFSHKLISLLHRLVYFIRL